MNFKEKLIHWKESFLQWVEEHKKVVIPTGMIGIVVLVLIMNMNLIQISYFTMKEMPTQVVNILTKAKPREYTHFYFKQGIHYLLTDLSETSQKFLEEHFNEFDQDIKNKILEKYNQKGLVFKDQKLLLDEIVHQVPSEALKVYTKRLDMVTFERALESYFGDQESFTQETINQLYKVLSLKGSKLPLEHFKMNIYGLLSMVDEVAIEDPALKLLDYVEPTAAKEILFTDLKTKEIKLETLDLWIDILNQKRIITTNEYAAFTNYRSMIKRLQEERKQIELKEVDLTNKQQSVDVQTEAILNHVQQIKKEMENVNQRVNTYNEEINQLKNYREVELYILDRYENGEYEAAIPEKSWLFGTYKPGKQKVRLQLTRSNVVDVGVQAFAVYDKGVKDDGSIYYVEISDEQLARIKELENSIQADSQILSAKQGEIDQLNQEIDQIRKANDYDATLSLMEELQLKKSNMELEIEKNKLAIQNLFGIGNILV